MHTYNEQNINKDKQTNNNDNNNNHVNSSTNNSSLSYTYRMRPEDLADDCAGGEMAGVACAPGRNQVIVSI